MHLGMGYFKRDLGKSSQDERARTDQTFTENITFLLFGVEHSKPRKSGKAVKSFY